MAHTYIRFERGRDDMGWLTLGPFEWVQITYNLLRVSEDGDFLAEYDEKDSGDWIISPSKKPMDKTFTERFAKYEGEIYSDIIIFSSEELLDLDAINKEDRYNHEAACKTSEQLEQES